MNIEHLKKYASIQDPMVPRRPINSHPWTIRLGEETWSIATDGRGILGCRGDGGFPPIDAIPDSPMFYRETIIKHMTAQIQGRKIPLAQVKKWIGNPVWLLELKCDTCDGTGKINCEATCKSGHHCTDCCQYASCDGGVQNCDDCAGTGKRPKFPRTQGIVDGKMYDCNYIACALEGFDVGDVEIAFGQQNELYLTGDGWRFLVMPMVWPEGMTPDHARKLDCGELVLA